MKKQKFLLPVIAMVFAIGSAFATVNGPVAKSVDIIEVTDEDNECDRVGTCDESGTNTCQNKDFYAPNDCTVGTPTGTFSAL